MKILTHALHVQHRMHVSQSNLKICYTQHMIRPLTSCVKYV